MWATTRSVILESCDGVDCMATELFPNKSVQCARVSNIIAFYQLKQRVLVDQNVMLLIGAGYAIHVLVPLEIVESDGVFQPVITHLIHSKNFFNNL